MYFSFPRVKGLKLYMGHDLLLELLTLGVENVESRVICFFIIFIA